MMRSTVLMVALMMLMMMLMMLLMLMVPRVVDWGFEVFHTTTLTYTPLQNLLMIPIFVWF